jgi:alpha-glucuronidase
MSIKLRKDYSCWLNYTQVEDLPLRDSYRQHLHSICVVGEGPIVQSIERELVRGVHGLTGNAPAVLRKPGPEASIIVATDYGKIEQVETEGYALRSVESEGGLQIVITGHSPRGLLYGTFAFLRRLQMGEALEGLDLVDNPQNRLRMINHWDNLDGSVERGYAGNSIFFQNNELVADLDRIGDYARLLASIGLNSVVVNNVNVHKEETELIAKRLDITKTLAEIFRAYGITLFLSVNYASPIELGALDSADPLNSQVQEWWNQQVAKVYEQIPDLGGFVVKADSEHRPGPFTYGRNHADGANMLGRALQPFGGILIWRCFVYNCQQDWRDRKTDRARAAYDHFYPLDGEFDHNVILQIKNGPMDFQVREPVSPLFGKLERTNQILELQITQEYTGQQRHLCYLVPQWKEIFEFDTYAQGPGSTVQRVLSGSVYPQAHSGIAAVVNVGDDPNWTGHTLAQANLYGYGRLTWDPQLTSEQITAEWVVTTFGHKSSVNATISDMLLSSWEIYENYTTPLGIGWMCNPGHHYGPNVDGYEYSKWGTYHRADHFGIGVDRTVKNGTGFVGQYHAENAVLYESMESCPEEFLLFFHRVPYTYILKSGKTLIQHIYDTHFLGVEQVEAMVERWRSLEGQIDGQTHAHVLHRLQGQLVDAREWRDVINTYFYRISRIEDKLHRIIY